jgi:hypothetical protein
MQTSKQASKLARYGPVVCCCTSFALTLHQYALMTVPFYTTNSYAVKNRGNLQPLFFGCYMQPNTHISKLLKSIAFCYFQYSHNSRKIKKKLPHFYTCLNYVNQKYRRIFEKCYFSYLACSQIWPNLLADHHRHFGYITKLTQKKTLRERE